MLNTKGDRGFQNIARAHTRIRNRFTSKKATSCQHPATRQCDLLQTSATGAPKTKSCKGQETFVGPAAYMNYSLNSLKGDDIRDNIAKYYRGSYWEW